MSSDEEGEYEFTDEQVQEIKRISNLKKKDLESKFLVSGWEDDTDGIIEEKNPRAKPETEILWAAENGELEVVKKLVDENPNIARVTDRDGYTPLHRACYNDHHEIVEFLLSKGADLFAKTADLWQPLHSACRWNNALSAAKLLDAGADINCKSQGGQTPLHLAASNGDAKETLQLLLTTYNIDTSIKNDNNETAYELAQRAGKYHRLFEIVNPNINEINRSPVPQHT